MRIVNVTRDIRYKFEDKEVSEYILNDDVGIVGCEPGLPSPKGKETTGTMAMAVTARTKVTENVNVI